MTWKPNGTNPGLSCAAKLDRPSWKLTTVRPSDVPCYGDQIPVRGPYTAGQLVLYWLKKKSPNRLAAGRWHGPAKVICQEGSSTVWISHGPKILRCAPEHLRPASLREWQSVQAQVHAELPLASQSVGGASTFIDLHAQEQP